jgi:two-component system chemotaxis response regulator CheB
MSVPESLPARLVGIGASAGGIDALLKVLNALPPELPHALLVVLHVPAHGQSLLAAILGRTCRLPVGTAADGVPVRPGHVYVAPPDRHLTIHLGALRLSSDAQENGVRPAVDPLLRSLAVAGGPRAVGVVLSGALGDGAGGALAIAKTGGLVFVQDPAEAKVPSMPLHTIAAVGAAARVLPAKAIAAELTRLGPVPELAIRPLTGTLT